MQKYDAIEKGISKNDIEGLRESVGIICYTCRDFSDGEFDEVVKYVESKGIKIKEDSLRGNPTISSQKNSFSDEDFARAVFELKKNFCNERIDDVKAIGRKLYGAKPVSKTDSRSKGTESVVNNTNAGTDPNYNSHQQEGKAVPIAMGVVAFIVVVIILLVKK